MRWPRRFLGLPLHPMLVHFPLAFWLSVPVLDGLALYAGRTPWWTLALTMTAAGVVIGAFAVISGLLDYVYLSETGSNDVRLAARHGVRTSVVWFTMTTKLVTVFAAGHSVALLAGCTIVDTLAAALLLQGALFGTRITYGKYGS